MAKASLVTITYLGYKIGNASISKNFEQNVTITHMFSSIDATPLDILAHEKVPHIGSSYSTSRKNLRCINLVTSHENEKGDKWEVECTYSAENDGEDGSSGVTVNIHPWDLAPEGIRFYPIAYEKVLDKAYLLTATATATADVWGTPTVPVRTTAGSRFPEAPMITYYNMGLSFSYNAKFTAQPNPTVLINRTNSKKTKVFGVEYAAKTMLIKDISFEYIIVRDSTGAVQSNQSYWKVDIVLEIDASEWNGKEHKLLVDNYDYYCLNSAKLTPIYRNIDPEDTTHYNYVGPAATVLSSPTSGKLLEKCELISTPWPLKEDGSCSYAMTGTTPDYTKPGVPHQSSFYPYFTLDYTSILLPSKELKDYK